MVENSKRYSKRKSERLKTETYKKCGKVIPKNKAVLFMPPSAIPCPLKPLERVMIFIDGAYLRKLSKQYYGHDRVDFTKFADILQRMYHTIHGYPFRMNLIRIYYYDAIVDKSDREYENRKKYFDSIDSLMWYTVRLGQLIRSSTKEFKQKGVDILMAIDVLTKAYQDHYDTGMFVMGDADFIPLIEAVKNAGKKTICVFHQDHSSNELIKTFDMNIRFDEKAIQSWLKNNDVS
jgi:uncharacterized LabA/DUF88 family protein